MNTLNYVNFYREASPECKSLVITCVDFRFRKQLADLLCYGGCRDFDLITMPGASRTIINRSSRDAVCEAIALVRDIHFTERLLIIDHVDCGAYGGSAAFKTPEEEEAFHIERLKEATGVLCEQYAGLEIVPMYIDWQKLRTVGGG
jgi:hypothetical protein